MPRMNGLVHEAECECPTCGSVVTLAVYAAIMGEQAAHDAEIRRQAEAQFATREAAIRREATAAANAASAPKLAKAEEGRKALERQMKALRTSQETVIAERLEAQRMTFEKAIGDAVLGERAKWATEKLGMESQLQDMQRRLQARTANQIGEPGEVNLYERLTTAFPDDRISRVPKGAPGPDVLVEVMQDGTVIGKIALDNKVHVRWQNKFTSKLRSDMIADGADFAILSTSVFPKDATQLHIQDGVIVADPGRVPVLVHPLRSQIIDNHTLRLTAEARDVKAERLLAYVVSPACRDLPDKIVRLTTDMAALDLKEADVHATTWKKRADLIRGLQSVHTEFAGAVSAIISGDRS